MRIELTSIQRSLAIQRLTALWAFAESGLGGMLHAFHIPVTGLVLGSVSVICISLIAFFSGTKMINILKSLLIVLIIKAVVSPQTPFPAYIAVAFQGLLGFIFYSVFRLNFISIIIVAMLAMLESALQKLLLVTMFFGQSLWRAIDEMVQFIGKPLGWETESGSMLIIGCYLFLYLSGGIITAIVAYKLVKQTFTVDNQIFLEPASREKNIYRKRKYAKWTLMVSGCAILIFSGLYKGAGAGVIQPLIWTIAVITLWYFIIVPKITRLLQKILIRSGSKYQAEAMVMISFFPYIRQITRRSWRVTGDRNSFTRIPAFTILLITTLISFEPQLLQDQ